MQEHKKLVGISEVDAKVKYTQLARSLKTYGITFFLVKVWYFFWCNDYVFCGCSFNSQAVLSAVLFQLLFSVSVIFWSIPLSQPNKVHLKCPSVRPSAKTFFDFNDIWNVGRGRWVMHDGMQYDRSKVKVKVTSLGKSEIRPLSKAISSPFIMAVGKWARILELGGNT